MFVWQITAPNLLAAWEDSDKTCAYTDSATQIAIVAISFALDCKGYYLLAQQHTPFFFFFSDPLKPQALTFYSFPVFDSRRRCLRDGSKQTTFSPFCTVAQIRARQTNCDIDTSAPSARDPRLTSCDITEQPSARITELRIPLLRLNIRGKSGSGWIALQLRASVCLIPAPNNLREPNLN